MAVPDPVDARLLALVADVGRVAVHDLAKRAGMDVREVAARLAGLASTGLPLVVGVECDPNALRHALAPAAALGAPSGPYRLDQPSGPYAHTGPPSGPAPVQQHPPQGPFPYSAPPASYPAEPAAMYGAGPQAAALWHASRQGPGGQHSPGQPSVGPYSSGPQSSGPHGAGPYGTGRHGGQHGQNQPGGPQSSGPHGTGSHTVAPDRSGPQQPGPHHSGPHHSEPYPSGPYPSGPYPGSPTPQQATTPNARPAADPIGVWGPPGSAAWARGDEPGTQPEQSATITMPAPPGAAIVGRRTGTVGERLLTEGIDGEQLAIQLVEVVDPADFLFTAAGYKLQDGERSVVVHTELTNRGGAAFSSLPDLYLVLVDAEGRAVTKAPVSLSSRPPHRIGVQPGETAGGHTVYVLPESTEIAAVRWSPRPGDDARSLTWTVE